MSNTSIEEFKNLFGSKKWKWTTSQAIQLSMILRDFFGASENDEFLFWLEERNLIDKNTREILLENKVDRSQFKKRCEYKTVVFGLKKRWAYSPRGSVKIDTPSNLFSLINSKKAGKRFLKQFSEEQVQLLRLIELETGSVEIPDKEDVFHETTLQDVMDDFRSELNISLLNRLEEVKETKRKIRQLMQQAEKLKEELGIWETK